jgi:cell division septation protein DedD
MWRWAWTAVVFGLFFVVIGAALDGAPRADGELPLIEPPEGPIKERVALPDIDRVVPRSTVLNLLADGDDPAAATPEAVAALEDELAASRAQERETARIEAEFERADPAPAASAASEAAPTPPAAPPDRRPEPAPAAEPAAQPAVEPERQVAARRSGGGFRIQLAAVPPGEEHATFERLKRRFDTALDGLAPRFQVVSTDAGVLVRVQAQGFANADAAAAGCARIRAAGGECFVVDGAG